MIYYRNDPPQIILKIAELLLSPDPDNRELGTQLLYAQALEIEQTVMHADLYLSVLAAMTWEFNPYTFNHSFIENLCKNEEQQSRFNGLYFALRLGLNTDDFSMNYMWRLSESEYFNVTGPSPDENFHDLFGYFDFIWEKEAYAVYQKAEKILEISEEKRTLVRRQYLAKRALSKSELRNLLKLLLDWHNPDNVLLALQLLQAQPKELIEYIIPALTMAEIFHELNHANHSKSMDIKSILTEFLSTVPDEERSALNSSFAVPAYYLSGYDISLISMYTDFRPELVDEKYIKIFEPFVEIDPEFASLFYLNLKPVFQNASEINVYVNLPDYSPKIMQFPRVGLENCIDYIRETVEDFLFNKKGTEIFIQFLANLLNKIDKRPELEADLRYCLGQMHEVSNLLSVCREKNIDLNRSIAFNCQFYLNLPEKGRAETFLNFLEPKFFNKFELLEYAYNIAVYLNLPDNHYFCYLINKKKGIQLPEWDKKSFNYDDIQLLEKLLTDKVLRNRELALYLLDIDHNAARQLYVPLILLWKFYEDQKSGILVQKILNPKLLKPWIDFFELSSIKDKVFDHYGNTMNKNIAVINCDNNKLMALIAQLESDLMPYLSYPVFGKIAQILGKYYAKTNLYKAYREYFVTNTTDSGFLFTDLNLRAQYVKLRGEMHYSAFPFLRIVLDAKVYDPENVFLFYILRYNYFYRFGNYRDEIPKAIENLNYYYSNRNDDYFSGSDLIFESENNIRTISDLLSVIEALKNEPDAAGLENLFRLLYSENTSNRALALTMLQSQFTKKRRYELAAAELFKHYKKGFPPKAKRPGELMSGVEMQEPLLSEWPEAALLHSNFAFPNFFAAEISWNNNEWEFQRKHGINLQNVHYFDFYELRCNPDLIRKYALKQLPAMPEDYAFWFLISIGFMPWQALEFVIFENDSKDIYTAELLKTALLFSPKRYIPFLGEIIETHIERTLSKNTRMAVDLKPEILKCLEKLGQQELIIKFQQFL